MGNADTKQATLIARISRILALAVLISCFIVNEGIDHVEFRWYEKLAWFFVFAFGFLGSITWIRSTYSAQDLKVNPTLQKVVWWVTGGLALIAMIVFVFGKLFSN